jgi:hypothetical protein
VVGLLVRESHLKWEGVEERSGTQGLSGAQCEKLERWCPGALDDGVLATGQRFLASGRKSRNHPTYGYAQMIAQYHCCLLLSFACRILQRGTWLRPLQTLLLRKMDAIQSADQPRITNPSVEGFLGISEVEGVYSGLFKAV